ncbi:MAG: hypothetical protein HY706_06760 [Candidatus Hydrogenedentes bacterium]|nr:hypothetical protein [Candidatus Hydrogenedentota bacterium]
MLGIETMSVKTAILAMVAGIAFAYAAEARDYKTYSNKKYGFEVKIPAEFELQSEDRTVQFIYQPGAAPTSRGGGEAKPSGKKVGLGGVLNKVGVDVGKTPEAAPAGGSSGELQPALMIYINWTWMPDVDSKTLYNANKKGIQDDISSPDPKYRDIVDFDTKKGYAYAGNTFRYKEIDKKDGAEIHRWHIYSAGNKSAYTIGLTGTFGQFKEWGPVYEEVIKSFKLIPMQEQK